MSDNEENENLDNSIIALNISEHINDGANSRIDEVSPNNRNQSIENSFNEANRSRLTNNFEQEISEFIRDRNEANERSNQYTDTQLTEVHGLSVENEEIDDRISELLRTKYEIITSKSNENYNYKEIFNYLPRTKLNKDLNQTFNCSICLKVFKKNDEVSALPCIHLFHSKCIFEWMKEKNNCPFCKTIIDFQILFKDLTEEDIMEMNERNNKKTKKKFSLCILMIIIIFFILVIFIHILYIK